MCIIDILHKSRTEIIKFSGSDSGIKDIPTCHGMKHN